MDAWLSREEAERIQEQKRKRSLLNLLELHEQWIPVDPEIVREAKLLFE